MQFSGMMDTALETPPNSADVALEIVTPKKRSCFTSANAREMALRAAKARAENKAKREWESLQPKPEPQAPDPNAIYVAQRIVRVRAQIEALDKRLERCKDAKDLKFIADSIAKLAELERVLSGRPAPGQYRPTKNAKSESERGKKTVLQPLDADPLERVA